MSVVPCQCGAAARVRAGHRRRRRRRALVVCRGVRVRAANRSTGQALTHPERSTTAAHGREVQLGRSELCSAAAQQRAPGGVRKDTRAVIGHVAGALCLSKGQLLEGKCSVKNAEKEILNK